MQYFSLNKQSLPVDFKAATIEGQAPDKGLYFPEYIPTVNPSMLSEMESYSDAEIAFSIMHPYTGDTLPREVLHRIVAETIDFNIPLVTITDRIAALELFHGPTLAFKDVGARFMSRCLGYFAGQSGRKITVLVATSGDTGGAVADGFYGVENVDVVILYPSGKVSSVQEQQLTTHGNNIRAIEVAGTFDDCQLLVKQAFADADLKHKLFLTSANSINIARWLPQQLYYFLAWKQWEDKDHPPVISVPSGNFGNIAAGILAYRSGLPVRHFIAACNANDVVPQFLQTGAYQPKPARATLSNAMDVGNPSNFVRVEALLSAAGISLPELLSSESISDVLTVDTLKELFHQYHYLADPHSAVGYIALQHYLARHPSQKGLLLCTAHPVKFYDVIEPVIGQRVPVPPAIQAILQKQKHSIKMEHRFDLLKDYLLNG
jgi:threonine synthase